MNMVDFLMQFMLNTWRLIAEMAAYLLFGFAVAGLLHVLIRPERVRQMLGKSGVGTVIKACLIGVPMPLCSCSVIPVAASLRKSGASRGATASFLSSTPQTGVDSILATYALMGGVFTIIRVIVAFISGLVSGVLVDLFAKEPKPSAPQLHPNIDLSPIQQPVDPSSVSFGSLAPLPSPKPKLPTQQQRGVKDAFKHGFVTLPADLATALIVGLVLAGLITTVIPDDLLSGQWSHGVLAFLLATLISLPLYVCATASIPMAYALIAAGLSPGAALIFLIVGPATNTATIVAVWKMLGQRATLIYIGSLVVISWLAGALFNATLSAEEMSEGIHQHEQISIAAWQHVSGGLLIALLLFAILNSRKKTTEKPSCCAA